MLASVFTKLAVELNENYAAQKRVCIVLVDNSCTHKVDSYEVQVRLFCNIIVNTASIDTVTIDAACRVFSPQSHKRVHELVLT